MLKIISGGQTGVDRGALDAALHHNMPCGGWCPPQRKAEDGRIPARYPMLELDYGDYAERSLQNVRDSDGTLFIYYGELTGGTELALYYCLREHRPYKLIDANEISFERAAELTYEFVNQHDVIWLNVVGPPESEVARGYDYAFDVVFELIRAFT